MPEVLSDFLQDIVLVSNWRTHPLVWRSYKEGSRGLEHVAGEKS